MQHSDNALALRPTLAGTQVKSQGGSVSGAGKVRGMACQF